MRTNILEVLLMTFNAFLKVELADADQRDMISNYSDFPVTQSLPLESLMEISLTETSKFNQDESSNFEKASLQLL
jgi:hypothetical protein